MQYREGNTIIIESQDRVSGSIHNALFHLPINTFEQRPRETIEIELLSFTIKYDKYNIVSTKNATCSYSEDAVLYELTIPDGNYSVNEIATVIQKLINTVATNYSWAVTYVSTLNKYLFTPTLGDGLDAKVLKFDFTQNILTTNSIWGFDQSEITITGPTYSTNMVQIGNDQGIYIHTDVNNRCVRTDGHKSSVFCIIPFIAQMYGLIYWETNRENLYTLKLNSPISSINIKFLNRNNQALEFQSEWTMIFKVKYVEEENETHFKNSVLRLLSMNLIK